MKILLLLCGLILSLTNTNAQKSSVKGKNTEPESATLDSAVSRVENETKALSGQFDKASDAYDAAVKNEADDHVLDSLKEVMAVIHDRLGTYNNRIQDLTLQFIATHPDSYVSAMKLIYFVNALPLDSVQHLYKNLSPVIRNSKYGTAIAKEIRKVISGLPGSVAPDFSTVDINNKPLRLSAFRGSYVLLDFWASWCVPCRQGNPHLVELFNRYSSKGFTIIGIADNDKQPQEWQKAVTKDKTGIWHHVLRKKRADLNAEYGIRSLPTKILIDRNGVIIGRYGEGGEDETALDKKLAALF